VQGQERDHVIVDYGINQETIRNEVKFLYNRNRLNVSITRFVLSISFLLINRAKKKCIVFMSEDFLCPIHEIFDASESENGFAYIKVSDLLAL
jgi:superfamily I DNA and/or RNA helicase